LIDSRTREAQAQRALADRAKVDADAQRTQTDAARRLADERLVATQSSQAQTASAQARARSAEEQLAEMKAKPTERGMVLTLGDVLFDTGRAELNPGATRPLDQLAQFLKENAQRTVAIEGYTDSVGTDTLNQVLSERRAIAVKNGLTDRGVASNRVSARGMGEASPVASNDTAAGRQRNRRVEVVLSNAM
jgi:outer membrane protein OmpA-like peptidoglycan-associated protein